MKGSAGLSLLLAILSTYRVIVQMRLARRKADKQIDMHIECVDHFIFRCLPIKGEAQISSSKNDRVRPFVLDEFAACFQEKFSCGSLHCTAERHSK